MRYAFPYHLSRPAGASVSRWHVKPIQQFRRPADPLLRAVQEPPVDHEAGLGAVLHEPRIDHRTHGNQRERGPKGRRSTRLDREDPTVG